MVIGYSDKLSHECVHAVDAQYLHGVVALSLGDSYVYVMETREKLLACWAGVEP